MIFKIVNIKKTLKTQLSERPDGVDDAMSSDNRDATVSSEKGKKSMKIKGKHGSKFWQRS